MIGRLFIVNRITKYASNQAGSQYQRGSPGIAQTI